MPEISTDAVLEFALARRRSANEPWTMSDLATALATTTGPLRPILDGLVGAGALVATAATGFTLRVPDAEEVKRALGRLDLLLTAYLERPGRYHLVRAALRGLMDEPAPERVPGRLEALLRVLVRSDDPGVDAVLLILRLSAPADAAVLKAIGRARFVGLSLAAGPTRADAAQFINRFRIALHAAYRDV